jgi:hypothetical protein
MVFNRFILTWIDRSTSRPCFVGHLVLVIRTSLFQGFPLLIINLTVAITRHVGTSFLIQMMTHLKLICICRSNILISFSLSRLRRWTQTKIRKRVIWPLLMMRWRYFLPMIFGILNSVFVSLTFLRLIGCISSEVIPRFRINCVIWLVRITNTGVVIRTLDVLHAVWTVVIVMQNRQIVYFSKLFGTFALNHYIYNNLKL